MESMTEKEIAHLAEKFGPEYWTEERWGAFLIGMRVASNYESRLSGPFTGVITNIDLRRGVINVKRDDGLEGGGVEGAWIIRREGMCSFNFIQILDTSMSTTSNALEFFRDMNDTEDSRLLKKYGLENPTNVPTEAGYQLARELMYADYRVKLIEIVKKMEAAAKSSKKASE